MLPVDPAVAVAALQLQLHLCLHPRNHLLHAAELSFLLQQYLVFIHVLIFYFPAASLEPLGPEVLIVQVLGHLLEILHVSDEHRPQLQEVVVLGFSTSTTPQG